MRRGLQVLLAFCLVSSLLHAEEQPFDLSGPKVDVRVKRGSVTLPIAETPNLEPGDRLWIHPDLPENQGAHFVLVVAFLRGSTNPPPPEWFTRVETWTQAVHTEGVFVTIPAGAQQALLFLAPETGGDFNTLRNTVRGRPGTFVRAAQNLQAASWERMRLEAYLDGVKINSQSNPASLKIRTEMAARSLGIKINEGCFLKPADQQATCLSQNSEGMVLDDANAQSLVNLLASGSTLDLMNELSSSPVGRGGAYSPYIGAIVDTAKILGSLHTAHFQYIPALALPKTETLNLRLNTPPSFRNPKSVVVVALPPVGPSRPEPLHAVNPDEDFCATKPDLVLHAEGAPLVYATQLAHSLHLHIETGSAEHTAVDLPVTPDAVRGGLVFSQPVPSLPAGELKAVLRGKWGFDDWEGPNFRMVSAKLGEWTVDDADRTALVVGREDVLHLKGHSTVCVEKVEAQTVGNRTLPLVWKTLKPGKLELTVSLKDAVPGPVNLAIHQSGLATPDQLTMEAYESAASLDHLTLTSGENTAQLKGTRLDEVAKAQVKDISLTPSKLDREGNFDLLQMAVVGATSSLEPGQNLEAHVELKDGRVFKAPVTVNPPRPQIALLNKGVQQDDSAAPHPVQMGNPNDFPIDGRLVFFLNSIVPSDFPRDEKIEVAAADSSFHTVLTLNEGGLMLVDAHTAVGNLDPLTRFGSSAFGPLRLRALAANGASSEWITLGTLVRTPGFKELRCPRAAAKPCLLTGTHLFLAAAFAATQSFDNPVPVAPDYTGTQLIVPHPMNGVLYLKLRDDSETVQTLTMPVLPLTVPVAAMPAANTPQTAAPPASSSSENTASVRPDTPPAAAQAQE